MPARAGRSWPAWIVSSTNFSVAACPHRLSHQRRPRWTCCPLAAIDEFILAAHPKRLSPSKLNYSEEFLEVLQDFPPQPFYNAAQVPALFRNYAMEFVLFILAGWALIYDFVIESRRRREGAAADEKFKNLHRQLELVEQRLRSGTTAAPTAAAAPPSP